MALCGNCKYFYVQDDADATEVCRRYPPKEEFDSKGDICDARFSWTDGSWWCGEYKPIRGTGPYSPVPNEED